MTEVEMAHNFAKEFLRLRYGKSPEEELIAEMVRPLCLVVLAADAYFTDTRQWSQFVATVGTTTPMRPQLEGVFQERLDREKRLRLDVNNALFRAHKMFQSEEGHRYGL